MMKKKGKLQTKIILIFAIIIIFLLGITCVVVNGILAKEIRKATDKTLYSNNQEVIRSLENQRKVMLMEIATLSTDQVLMEQLISSDENKVFLALERVFKSINDKGIDVLTISDKNGRIIARAHDPQKRGDNKGQLPLYQYALKGDTASGYESGAAGLAVRGIGPLKDKRGNVAGTIMVGQKILQSSLDEIKKGSGADIAIYENNKIMATTMTENNQDIFGKELDDKEVLNKVLKQKETYEGERNVFGCDYQVLYQPLLDEDGQAIGMIFTGVPKEIIIQAQRKNISMLAFIGLLGALVGILVIWFFSGKIVKPICNLTEVAAKIAEGDLRQQVNVYGQDEIADLSMSFNDMSTNLLKLVNKIKNSTEQIEDFSANIAQSSEESAKASSEVATTITQIAEDASIQANMAQLGNEKMSSLNSKIIRAQKKSELVYSQSQESYDWVMKGLEAIDRQNKVMQENNQVSKEVNHAMQVLLDSANEIDTIIEAISNIANQTNLLSLNAAIEAARAGEAGRGFAVVAEEIGKLANQSQEASCRIAEIINNIQNETDKTANEVNKLQSGIEIEKESLQMTQETFKHIIQTSEVSKEEIQEITAYINQVELEAVEVVKSITEITNLSEVNAAGAEEISATSEEQSAIVQEITDNLQELSRLSQELGSEIRYFKI